jgi:branched-chain amino acid transport system permease protein
MPTPSAAPGRLGPRLALAGLLGAAALLPLAAGQYVIHLAVMILFFAYLGVAWNILGGYAGQFSFGHAAFFGLGAFTSTILSVDYGVSPWLGMLAAGLVGVVLGLFTGFLSFRYGLRGPYFALVMLAFAETLRLLFESWMARTYPLGMPIPLKGTSLVDFQFTDKGHYFWVILGMLAAATWLCHRLARSRVGAYWMAIRDNEDAAEALGVNAFAGKLLAMALSAFLTAMGGTFYAQYFLTIEANEVFGVHVSVEILLTAIIGGTGTVFGPLVGSAALQLLSEGTRVYIRAFSGFDLMVYGAILIVVIIFLPQGLLEGLRTPARALHRALAPRRAATPGRP